MGPQSGSAAAAVRPSDARLRPPGFWGPAALGTFGPLWSCDAPAPHEGRRGPACQPAATAPEGRFQMPCHRLHGLQLRAAGGAPVTRCSPGLRRKLSLCSRREPASRRPRASQLPVHRAAAATEPLEPSALGPYAPDLQHPKTPCTNLIPESTEGRSLDLPVGPKPGSWLQERAQLAFGCLRISSFFAQKGDELIIICNVEDVDAEEREGLTVFWCKNISSNCPTENNLKLLKPKRNTADGGVLELNHTLQLVAENTGTYQCGARSEKAHTHHHAHSLTISIAGAKNYTVTGAKQRYEHVLSSGVLLEKGWMVLVTSLVALQAPKAALEPSLSSKLTDPHLSLWTSTLLSERVSSPVQSPELQATQSPTEKTGDRCAVHWGAPRTGCPSTLT
ncbi:CD160 antigen [Galemys pyrenaicus]|uniref:CD160 antigen n=1 Tax=Galemys pyrenaicus TaxID=202257 RepID=A0A8J6AEK9_GALPY|nr:CD160 antigen [Galemys pyrenaicus]